MSPVDWDAKSYAELAGPHEDWADEVLERSDLRGDERVLDAGCGTGKLTRRLLASLPDGEVLAVDASASMVAATHEALPEVQALEADLIDLRLAEPVDVVVSSAVFHWIDDHDQLFRRLHAVLRPGGRLVAQCGGEGNVAEWTVAVSEASARDPFRSHLNGIRNVWNFAGPAETERRLLGAGFTEARCWLTETRFVPDDPVPYICTVGLSNHLAALPDELHGGFVDAVLERMASPVTLEYVRLNIEARA